MELKVFKPKNWSEITLEQFSEYNKALVDFTEKTEELDIENSKDANQILIEEVHLNFAICKAFSGLSEEEVYTLDIAWVKDYVVGLTFLTQQYEAKELKSFEFEGITYNVPDSLPLNTKFGQYIEALQAEMNSRYTDKNSVIYLAHQLAHIVDNGEDWNGEYRDELAEKFKRVPVSLGFDFAFFLSKKCQIYSLAYLKLEAEAQVKRLPFIKRILHRLGGLKHYMNWRSLRYLINLTTLRLIVFYILIREMFSTIYRTLQLKATTSRR